MQTETYSLNEIKECMEKEGIGRSSTRYVIETLKKMKSSILKISSSIVCETKEKPTYLGIKVSPQSNNHVRFEHKGEDFTLHFLVNGNIALSRETNKHTYLEIDKNQLMELLITKI